VLKSQKTETVAIATVLDLEWCTGNWFVKCRCSVSSAAASSEAEENCCSAGGGFILLHVVYVVVMTTLSNNHCLYVGGGLEKSQSSRLFCAVVEYI